MSNLVERNLTNPFPKMYLHIENHLETMVFSIGILYFEPNISEALRVRDYPLANSHIAIEHGHL